MTTQVTRGVTVEERQQRNELIFDHWLAGWTETEIAEKCIIDQGVVSRIVKNMQTSKAIDMHNLEKPPIYNVWNYAKCDPRFGQDYPGRATWLCFGLLETAIAKELGVNQSTIARWFNSNHGDNTECILHRPIDVMQDSSCKDTHPRYKVVNQGGEELRMTVCGNIKANVATFW